MAVGSSLLSLLGNKDPREALLQAVVQGSAAAQQPQGGAPYAAQPAGGGGATAPTPAPAAGVQASQPADALASPPDLAKMFQDIISYDSRARNIDRGFGLIGSAVSQDGNRGDTLRAFTGDAGLEGGVPSLGGVAELAMGMQAAQLKAKQRAAMMAALPSIAKRYNLDLETAQYLYDTGELDALIKEAEKPANELRELGNGQVALIDKNRNVQLGIFGDPKTNIQQVADPNRGALAVDLNNPADAGRVIAPPDNRTGDQKDYNFYKAQEEAAGRVPLSFNDWSLQAKKAAANSVTVNNDGPKLESEFDKKRGGYQAERLDAYNKAADNAMDMLSGFDAIEAGLNTGVRTGSFGEGELNVRRFASTVLGMGDEEVQNALAGGELIQKMSNRMALLMRNPESGMGMPGSVSDKDIEFLKQSQIGLSSSEPGNKAALEVFRRLERRKIEYAELAEEYADKNGSMRGFREHARKYFDANPLFDDLKQQLIEKQSPDERRTNDLIEKYRTKK